MRLLILLFCFTISQANDILRIIIDDVSRDYEKEILRTDITTWQPLALDYGTNNLYLKYKLKNESGITRSGRINLDKNILTEIEGTTPSTEFSRTVDQLKQEVYINGYQGIFKYNYWKNTLTLIYPVQMKIWNLYYQQSTLYLSTFDFNPTLRTFQSQHLYTLKDGNIAKFPDLEDTTVYNFAIDGNYMFFSNNTGLYGQKKGNRDRIKYKDLTSVIEVLQLTNDKFGRVYALLSDGIYIYKPKTDNFEKLVTVYAYGLAFDRDNNFVFSELGSLYRLKPVKY